MKEFRITVVTLTFLFASVTFGQRQLAGSGDVAIPIQGAEPNVLSSGDMSGPVGTPLCKSVKGGGSTNCATIEATTLPGVDVGAKINAAYAALPSSGGVITVAPSARCYDFATPINLNIVGKYVELRG